MTTDIPDIPDNLDVPGLEAPAPKQRHAVAPAGAVR